jgi:hypothetical protein
LHATLAAGLLSPGWPVQVRRAGSYIGREPFILGAGLLATTPTIIKHPSITVIGIPLASVSSSPGAWPYPGYIVAGIRRRAAARQGRSVSRAIGHMPRRCSLIILMVGGIIPLVTFLASWFGLAR